MQCVILQREISTKGSFYVEIGFVYGGREIRDCVGTGYCVEFIISEYSEYVIG